MNKIILIIATVCTMIFASCRKDGKFITHPEHFELQLKWFYTPNGNVFYKAEIDGKLLTDSLCYDISEYNFAKKIFVGESNGMKRLLLRERDTDSTVLDTMIQVTGRASFQLLSIGPGDRPRIMSGADGETEPDPSARNRNKIRYYYSEPRLPDSIVLRFYTINISSRPFTKDEPSFGDMLVRRGEFSPYLEYLANPHGRNTGVLFELFDAATMEMIQPIVFRNPVALIFADGSSPALSGVLDNSSGEPRNKFMTCIMQWGSYAGRERFYDFRLFETPWE